MGSLLEYINNNKEYLNVKFLL